MNAFTASILLQQASHIPKKTSKRVEAIQWSEINSQWLLSLEFT